MLFAQVQSQTGLLAMMTGSEIAVWVAIACAIFIPLMGKRRTGERCKRRGGWAWVWVLVLVPLTGAFVFYTNLAHKPGSIAQRDAQAARQLAEQLQARIQTNRNVQKSLEETAQKQREVTPQTMQEAWERLNKPRIDLAADGRSATAKIVHGMKSMEIRAGDDTGAKVLVVPIAENSSVQIGRAPCRERV